MDLNSYPLLSKINHPDDLRQITRSELDEVCQELRAYLIETILNHGGHFSANLGVVELTVALHFVFETPSDKLIWDVGHQAYGHKVLTGRRDALHSIRKKAGLSGFPKREESIFDDFGTGHSSTSISALLGMAEASLLLKKHNKHIAVIGDGSLTAGQAFEALNHAGMSKSDVLIVVNDNSMGIDPNLGALNQHLINLASPENSENLFNALGLPYFGPYDGHDVQLLIDVFEEQKSLNYPRVVHIKTIKGKGYAAAEKEQTKWHAAASYVKMGAEQESQLYEGEKYQTVFGEALLELAKMDEKVVGITPAMPTGCSMNIMMEVLPDRVFDVGIAEQHAVTLSAGMASSGLIPFCNIYSSFLQRAYDQVIHDVCLQQLPVILCIDRAGVVGEDGPTHHGMFDLAYLRIIPDLIVASPRDEITLRNLMYTAYLSKKPFAIRYPRGKGPKVSADSKFKSLEIGRGKIVLEGKSIALLGLGNSVNELLGAAALLKEAGISCTVIDMQFLKPLDEAILREVFDVYEIIYTLEDGCMQGGFGTAVLEWANKNEYKKPLHILGFPDEWIGQGTRSELMQEFALNYRAIAERIKQDILR